ncbi:MAG TPA: AmmeMemoRadiSam system protein B [Desulfobacteraceae bacterium]|nr:AmmeMemoRadiSam system protein B [Desulfobacteraceae bacterium]
MKHTIRKALLAGTWYHASPGELKRQIETFAAEAPSFEEEREKTLLAVVTPHAGIDYSGRVAACTWKVAAERSYDAVIVIGPSHRVRFKGAAVYGGSGYESPLGVLPVDQELAGRLVGSGHGVIEGDDEGIPENAIELQVPFIQMMLPGVPFVPVTMGTQDRKTCDGLAAAIIDSIGDRRVLIAASSDLSHYLGYEEAVKTDSDTLAYLKRRDIEGFHLSVERGLSHACGSGAMAVAMTVAQARGCDETRVLSYANSGDITGDKSGVVGYAAVAFFRNDESGDERYHGGSTKEDKPELTDQEKSDLIAIARARIEESLKGKRTGDNPVLTSLMKQPRGAFVTLKKHGMLRGCIGMIEPRKPLHKAVEDMARAAAFDDPRFPPLSPSELGEITFEISVLTPLREIRDVEEIEVGRHGLYIVKGSRAGLLLPQVALEQRWDRTTFLEETCRKAGLSEEAWKDHNTVIYVFSAEVFGEYY